MGLDLKNMTANDAIYEAFMQSPKSREEISDETHYSYETIARYFNPNDNYQPPLRNIPTLCRVLGNTILVDWIVAQLDHLSESHVLTVKRLLKGAAKLGAEVGDVFKEVSDVAGDGEIAPEKAMRLNGELADVENNAHEMREGLQAIAGQVLEGGKLKMVNLSRK